MFRRFMATMVVMATIVAACGGQTPAEVPASEPAPSEPPITTAASADTTTLPVATSVDLCRGRGIVWEPGVDYTADCFIVPVSFAPGDEGWRTNGASGEWVLVTLAEGGVPVAEVALLAYRPSAGTESIVDSILELDGLTVVSEQRDVTAGGLRAVTFDVVSAPDPSSTVAVPIDECNSLSVGVVIGAAGGPGWPLLESGGLDGDHNYGFSPCRAFRVWVVDVRGTVVTVLAAADTEVALTEAMPRIERLLAALRFEAP